MTLIWRGVEKFDPAKIIPIKNSEFRSKPLGGVWTSPAESEYSWTHWCLQEGFRLEKLKYLTHLVYEGRTLLIDSLEDCEGLPLISKRGYGSVFLDFEILAQTIDAIHLTHQGEYITSHSYPGGFYGWDCETVLILNPASIILGGLT